MKGRRPESAFGAFTEHFPPRTGFVVREITVSAGGFRALAPAAAVLPQSTGQGTQAASDGGPAALSPAPPRGSAKTQSPHLSFSFIP